MHQGNKIENLIIKIEFSVNFEIERIFEVVNELDWYKENRYRVDLPFGINLTSIEKLSKEKIKKLVLNEYFGNDYKQMVEKIKNEWEKIDLNFDKIFLNADAKLEPVYILILTKYGIGGSYKLPNKIIINFTNRRVEDILYVAIHEIIHLLIEHLIIKHQLNHWQKERLVDLIFSEIKPELNKMQKIPEATDEVDKVFKQYFPDIETVIKNIA